MNYLNTNSYVFQSAKRLAEEALNRCFKKLKENEKKWNESLNLKLYDCYGMNEFETDFGKIVLNDEVASNAFYTFCESSYDMMVEDLKESYNINFADIADYIGRTSSFYIGKANNNEKDKYTVALARLSDTWNNSCVEHLETENGFTIREDIFLDSEDDIEQYINDMLDIAQNVEREFEEAFHKIEVVYDYITDFKEHQVEYFKDYVLDFIQTW
jgi:hypothetical protein